jgi:hypothetical protein
MCQLDTMARIVSLYPFFDKLTLASSLLLDFTTCEYTMRDRLVYVQPAIL